MSDQTMELKDCLHDEVPAWMIEDQLTEARRYAQNGQMDKCKESTEKALKMLTNTPRELFDLDG